MLLETDQLQCFHCRPDEHSFWRHQINACEFFHLSLAMHYSYVLISMRNQNKTYTIAPFSLFSKKKNWKSVILACFCKQSKILLSFFCFVFLLNLRRMCILPDFVQLSTCSKIVPSGCCRKMTEAFEAVAGTAPPETLVFYMIMHASQSIVTK